MMENMPENGVQRLSDVIVEQRSEEDTPMLHLELEDSEDANIHEINMSHGEEMEQDIEAMVIYVSFFLCFLCLKKNRPLFYHFILRCIS